MCDKCGRVHETLGGLAAHKRSLGNWRCGGCDASYEVGVQIRGRTARGAVRSPRFEMARGATGPRPETTRVDKGADDQVHCTTRRGLGRPQTFCEKGLENLVDPDDDVATC